MYVLEQYYSVLDMNYLSHETGLTCAMVGALDMVRGIPGSSLVWVILATSKSFHSSICIYVHMFVSHNKKLYRAYFDR